MYLGRRYSLWSYLSWTRREIGILVAWSALVTGVLRLLPDHLLRLPLSVLAFIGTALAIVLGFKNQECHARVREAVMVCGAFRWNSLNLASRAASALAGLGREAARARLRPLLQANMAMLTAMRFFLREEKPWENLREGGNARFMARIPTPESQSSLEAELARILPEEEVRQVLAHRGDKLHLLMLRQYEIVGEWRKEGLLGDELCSGLLSTLDGLTSTIHAGKRLKSFPFPRNFYSIAVLLVWCFAAMVPFAFVQVAEDMIKAGAPAAWAIWLNVPLSAFVGWFYVTLEKVGENSANPWEGGPNDAPVSAIFRSVEIDLRLMLGEATELQPLAPRFDILH